MTEAFKKQPADKATEDRWANEGKGMETSKFPSLRTLGLAALGTAAIAAGAIGIKSLWDNLPSPKAVEKPAAAVVVEVPAPKPAVKVQVPVVGESLFTLQDLRAENHRFFVTGYTGYNQHGGRFDYIKKTSLLCDGNGGVYSGELNDNPLSDVEREVKREWDAVQHILRTGSENPRNKAQWFTPDVYKYVLGGLTDEGVRDNFRGMMALKEKATLDNYYTQMQNGFPGGVYVLPKNYSENMINILVNMHGISIPVPVRTWDEAQMNPEQYQKYEQDFMRKNEFGPKQKLKVRVGDKVSEVEGWPDVKNGVIHVSPSVSIKYVEAEQLTAEHGKPTKTTLGGKKVHVWRDRDNKMVHYTGDTGIETTSMLDFDSQQKTEQYGKPLVWKVSGKDRVFWPDRKTNSGYYVDPDTGVVKKAPMGMVLPDKKREEELRKELEENPDLAPKPTEAEPTEVKPGEKSGEVKPAEVKPAVLAEKTSEQKAQDEIQRIKRILQTGKTPTDDLEKNVADLTEQYGPPKMEKATGGHLRPVWTETTKDGKTIKYILMESGGVIQQKSNTPP